MVTLYTIVLLILFVVVPWCVGRIHCKVSGEKAKSWFQDWGVGILLILTLVILCIAVYGIWSLAHHVAETFINEYNIR